MHWHNSKITALIHWHFLFLSSDYFQIPATEKLITSPNDLNRKMLIYNTLTDVINQFIIAFHHLSMHKCVRNVNKIIRFLVFKNKFQSRSDENVKLNLPITWKIKWKHHKVTDSLSNFIFSHSLYTLWWRVDTSIYDYK